VPVQLTGLGSAGFASNQLGVITLGVALLVLGGGLLLFTMRRPVAPAPLDQDAIEQERLQLLVRLASLDDRFVAGEIATPEYEFERERGKRRLVELTLLQRRTAPASS
jgi:hypothetical protein